jgi:hypothetical protein
VIVHVDLAELTSRDLAEPLVHVREVLRGRFRAVEAPHHHRYITHIALRDPANIVLVVPRRDAGCPTKITSVDLDERRLRSCHGAPRIDRERVSRQRSPVVLDLG